MENQSKISEIEFHKPALDMPVGGEEGIAFSWEPDDIENPDGIELSCNPPDICEVSMVSAGKAVLKGLASGDATVAVTAGEAGDSMRVRVRPMLERIILPKEVITIKLGQRTQTVPVKFFPEDSYKPDVIATVADENIVRFRGNRLLPVREGETHITIKSKTSGVTAKCKVIVESAGYSKGGIGVPMYAAMLLMVLSFTLPFPWGQFTAATALLCLCYAYLIVRRFTVEILLVFLASLFSVFRGYLGL